MALNKLILHLNLQGIKNVAILLTGQFLLVISETMEGPLNNVHLYVCPNMEENLAIVRSTLSYGALV